MKRANIVIVILIVGLVLESYAILAIYTQPRPSSISSPQYTVAAEKSITIPYVQFNQPISNDTEYSLDEPIEGSWTISIVSLLVASPGNLRGSEAQVAIAPEYPSENLSIPAIIVQERADGLLRVEYFAQNWENTYGLVLYNSTNPGWQNGNVTLEYKSYGPPVAVNPQLAPYPNGNLTITVGSTSIVSNYPIAWANLSSLYIYGLKGSSFTAGTISITIYEVKPRS